MRIIKLYSINNFCLDIKEIPIDRNNIYLFILCNIKIKDLIKILFFKNGLNASRLQPQVFIGRCYQEC